VESRRTAALLLSCVLSVVAMRVTSSAKSAESAAGAEILHGGAQRGYANLKVLPPDISQADLVQVMVRYGQEIGVQCEFCHAENPQTQQVDFASDENPRKQTARIMIGMLRDINTKYLPQVGDRRYVAPISCGNCHQGQTYPPAYEPRP
jgi:Photosynthetic reaction centre cytochrome C subunit